MSLRALTTLYSGPTETGSSGFLGLCAGERYNNLTHDRLSYQGLLDSVSSGTMTCVTADLHLVLFDNADYTGDFFQLSKIAGGDATFWHTGPAQSALLIVSNTQGETEYRLSFRDRFQSKWDTILDERLSGKDVSRVGEPLLTWTVFPESVSYLDSSQVYLRIHQPLHINMPWYWSDYGGYMDYHLALYINRDGQLRAWGARWECNVDSGAKHDKIMDQLAPEVRDGLRPLQDNINEELQLTDLLGRFKDVYYLPGSQPAELGTAGGISGDTRTDVTIVVVS